LFWCKYMVNVRQINWKVNIEKCNKFPSWWSVLFFCLMVVKFFLFVFSLMMFCDCYFLRLNNKILRSRYTVYFSFKFLTINVVYLEVSLFQSMPTFFYLQVLNHGDNIFLVKPLTRADLLHDWSKKNKHL